MSSPGAPSDKSPGETRAPCMVCRGDRDGSAAGVPSQDTSLRVGIRGADVSPGSFSDRGTDRGHQQDCSTYQDRFPDPIAGTLGIKRSAEACGVMGPVPGNVCRDAMPFAHECHAVLFSLSDAFLPCGLFICYYTAKIYLNSRIISACRGSGKQMPLA